MVKLIDLLFESVDLYSLDDLESKGIEVKIEEESRRRFSVEIQYGKYFYLLRILPIFNPKRSSVNFGSSDETYQILNLNQLLGVPHSPRILATVFGLLRYWVDKYDIQEFEYGAEGEVRTRLYEMYLRKHFREFDGVKEHYGDHTIYVWKKRH